MKRKSHRQHLPTTEDTGREDMSDREAATILNSSVSTQLDVCRCPKCEAPMVARQGRTGPYFHCQCPPLQAAG